MIILIERSGLKKRIERSLKINYQVGIYGDSRLRKNNLLITEWIELEEEC